MADMPKQYMFVSHRNITITSTQGYSIAFEKGIPIHVPLPMHSEVMEKGVVPVEAKDAEAMAELESKVKIMVAPEDAGEREEKVFDVFEALVRINDAKNFTAAGVPSALAVSTALGWRIEPKEIRPIWDKFRQRGKE